MKRFSAAVPADERGFILVGVVMFMIALTILGLSLFALSSYEAQFFYASQSREQALQSSEGGMEVVKSLLSDPGVPSSVRYRLEAAQLAVGHFGISQALAYQARSGNPNDTTSRGPVNWDSTLVIVVTARAGGEERSVQSRFRPVPNKNPYQQLISAGQGLWYNTKHATTTPTLQLTGAVWQHVVSGADSAWTGFVSWPWGRPVDPSLPPTPSASAFVNAQMAATPPPREPEPADLQLQDEHQPYFITFDDAPATAPFYKLPANSSPVSGEGDPEWNDHYQFYCDKRLEIRIHGTAVWLVDQGVCFGGKVTVVPDPDMQPDPDHPDVLVIVAKPNPNGSDPNRGIWFQGGLVNDSTETRVFLVSDGDISLTQDHSSGTSLDAQAVSIVAGGTVELMGPASGEPFKVAHAASMNALADDLVAAGLLPLPSGGSSTRFALVQHTWLETRLP
jgi:hypothetical protein